MQSEERLQLRETFTQAADLYDRMRPTYPPATFDQLAEFGQLATGSTVLEIGCGTGQATLPLAQRGYRVTAIELGHEMAAIARRNLAAFVNVEIIETDFETWSLPDQPFDAVVAATAFHWLDPATRVARAAAALRTGGTIALIGTHHIAGGDAAFFAEVQDCYERWDPATPPGLRLQTPAEIPPDIAELDDSGLFEPVHVHRYERTQTYSTAEYRDLLLTYSGHRALDSSRRAGLLECIATLMESGYGGRITKRYLTELRLARRRGFVT
jgi:SAM-dependent methyltransferase